MQIIFDEADGQGPLIFVVNDSDSDWIQMRDGERVYWLKRSDIRRLHQALAEPPKVSSHPFIVGCCDQRP